MCEIGREKKKQIVFIMCPLYLGHFLHFFKKRFIYLSGGEGEREREERENPKQTPQ